MFIHILFLRADDIQRSAGYHEFDTQVSRRHFKEMNMSNRIFMQVTNLSPAAGSVQSFVFLG